jgi:Ca-activated chloride channel family protein
MTRRPTSFASSARSAVFCAAWLATMLVDGPVVGQTFRAEIERVLLDVAVTRNGRPVDGLSLDDFTVVEGDVPQRIDRVLRADTLPVSALMAFDTSASVAGDRLTNLIAAGHAAIASLRPRDRVALVTFSTPVTVRVPLTSDTTAVAAALATLRGSGGTALRDAMWTTVQLRPLDTSRPVVLLFTDGADSSSWVSAADALEGIKRAGVIVHAVGLGRDDVQVPPPRLGNLSIANQARRLAALESSGWRFLEDFVNASGGRLWSADTPGDLADLFARAIDEMRARYVLAVVPARPIRPGWHPLRVQVKGGGEVRAQSGYFVPRPASSPAGAEVR